MSDIAAYFGSFDPVTKGHISVLYRALDEGLAERVIVVVKPSPVKCHLLERSNAHGLFLTGLPDDLKDKVSVQHTDSILIWPPAGATKYLRGIRDETDAPCEKEVELRVFYDAAKLSCARLPIVTIIDPPRNVEARISSTHVRDLLIDSKISVSCLARYVPTDVARILVEARHEAASDLMRHETITAFNRSIAAKLDSRLCCV